MNITKKKLASLALIVFGLALILFSTNIMTSNPMATATVTVRVQDANTGMPISGAHVQVYTYSFNQLTSGTTNGEGNVVIAVDNSNSFLRVSVEASGYQDYLYGGLYLSSPSATVNMSPSATPNPNSNETIQPDQSSSPAPNQLTPHNSLQPIEFFVGIALVIAGVIASFASTFLDKRKKHGTNKPENS